jgi:hypothetical protein
LLVQRVDAGELLVGELLRLCLSATAHGKPPKVEIGKSKSEKLET